MNSLLALFSFFLVMHTLHAAHIQEEKTPVINYLNPIESVEIETGLSTLDCIYVLTLNERENQWNLVQKHFEQRGIKVSRVRAHSHFLGSPLIAYAA